MLYTLFINLGIFAQNAEYAELSKALSTDAKIKALGGVEGAASVDRAKAMIDAHQEKGFVDGTMQTAMEKVAKSGERLGEAIEHIARDLAAGKLSGDAASINAAQQIAKQMTGQNMSPTEAMMLLAQQRAGNVSGIVSPDGTATYDYRVSGKHAEVAARRTGRDEDVMNKFKEFVADTFGDDALYYGAGAAAGLGALGIAGKSIKGMYKGYRWLQRRFSSSSNSLSASAINNITPGMNTVRNPNNIHAPGSMTPPSSSSHTNVPHHQGHVNIPSGYTQTSSGLIVPHSAASAVEEGAEVAAKGGLKTFMKKIPLVGLLASLAFAGQRAYEGDYSGAGLELLSGAAGTIPGIGTTASLGIDGYLMARDSGLINKAYKEATGMSLGAANALQHPTDLNQSIRSQIESAHALKNMEQAMINQQHNQMFARQLINPVAPARGATFETLGGELTFGQNNSGYLKNRMRKATPSTYFHF